MSPVVLICFCILHTPGFHLMLVKPKSLVLPVSSLNKGSPIHLLVRDLFSHPIGIVSHSAKHTHMCRMEPHLVTALLNPTALLYFLSKLVAAPSIHLPKRQPSSHSKLLSSLSCTSYQLLSPTGFYHLTSFLNLFSSPLSLGPPTSPASSLL